MTKPRKADNAPMTPLVGQLVAGERRAHPIVELARRDLRFPITCVSESRKGTNFARNAAMAACVDECDWIAFIDDDETPAVTWLKELFTVQRHSGKAQCRGAERPPGPAPSRTTAVALRRCSSSTCTSTFRDR